MSFQQSPTPSSILRQQIKQSQFNLRALDISITELQYQLSTLASPDRAHHSPLEKHLLQAQIQRQEMVFEIACDEVELELLQMREQLGSEVAPRCRACSVAGRADGAGQMWPMRVDSLAQVDRQIVPRPLDVVRRPAGAQPFGLPRLERLAGKEAVMDKSLRKQASLRGLTKMFRSRKPSGLGFDTRKPAFPPYKTQ